MNIGEILNGVYDDELGWRPASGGIKPVHVANGLVRALLRRHYDNTRLVEFIVWWKKRGAKDEDRTLEALLRADDSGALKEIASSPKDFEKARRYLNGILAADGGVFPSAENSDLTLTCAQMTSRSGNDRRLGEFAVALLRRDDQDGALGLAVRRALDTSRPSDPVSAAAWPLLDSVGAESSEKAFASKALRRAHSAEILRELRLAADDLASHESRQGNRLRTLERTVQFSCVATQAHAQALAANGRLASRIPELIAAMPGKGHTVAMSSERALLAVWDSFESWLAEKLAARLEGAKSPRGDEDDLFAEEPASVPAYRAEVRKIGGASEKHEEPDSEVLADRVGDYKEALKSYGGAGWRPVAHALVRSYEREYESGGPKRFLQNLGRRVGLLYPHFQGRSREKRVRPSVGVLDMLVRSCVPAGDLLPMDDFLERLWHRFGLVTGGRRTPEWDDGDALSSHGIDVDTGELALNHVYFVTQLESMGLARRYADNVTFVGDGHDA